MVDFTKKNRIGINLGTSTIPHKTGNLIIRRRTRLGQEFAQFRKGNFIGFLRCGGNGRGQAEFAGKA